MGGLSYNINSKQVTLNNNDQPLPTHTPITRYVIYKEKVLSSGRKLRESEMVAENLSSSEIQELEDSGYIVEKLDI